MYKLTNQKNILVKAKKPIDFNLNFNTNGISQYTINLTNTPSDSNSKEYILELSTTNSVDSSNSTLRMNINSKENFYKKEFSIEELKSIIVSGKKTKLEDMIKTIEKRILSRNIEINEKENKIIFSLFYVLDDDDKIRMDFELKELSQDEKEKRELKKDMEKLKIKNALFEEKFDLLTQKLEDKTSEMNRRTNELIQKVVEDSNKKNQESESKMNELASQNQVLINELNKSNQAYKEDKKRKESKLEEIEIRMRDLATQNQNFKNEISKIDKEKEELANEKLQKLQKEEKERIAKLQILQKEEKERIAKLLSYKYIVNYNSNIDYLIKERTEFDLLKDNIGGNPKFELLYKASRDGFASTIFHNKCDNKGPTVVVALNEHGFRIGGYSSLNWKSGGKFVADRTKSCFIFSFNQQLVFKQKKAGQAIWNCSDNGPAFGSGGNLEICNNCNTTDKGSYTRLGNDNCYEGEGKDKLFSGADRDQKFLIKDYEVYKVIK